MILAFEFYYVSQNGVLEKLLKESALDFGISHKIIKENSLVTLYTQADEERLGAFADYLSTALPLSIFFKSSSVYVVEAMPSQEETFPSCTHDVVFTPKILALHDSIESPLYQCPFREKSTQKVGLFKGNENITSANETQEYAKFYALIADLIKEGKTITVEKSNCHYTIGQIELLSSLPSLEGIDIVATDLSVIERMVVIKENEIKALASLERPAIRLKVNAFFAQKGILPTSRVTMRLSDDFFLYHLSKILFEQGILFLFKTSKPLCDTEYKMTLPETAIAPLQISVFENGEIVILEGSDYASEQLKQGLDKFEEPAHGAFVSIMQEHHFFETTSSCFYLSRTHSDRIMHYSKEHGMLNFVEFPLPLSFEELFAEIKRSSPSALRLVENFEAQFPEIYAKALACVIPPHLPQSIYSLWKIVAIILGLSDNFDHAAEQLIENAEDFGGQKGPRMDYYLQKQDALSSDFDYVRLMRSAMSYKLAGTDDTTLSFGLMESLAYFLSDTADAHKENLLTEKIALAGSLFGYKRLSELVIKNIKPNHTICFNKELPIDR